MNKVDFLKKLVIQDFSCYIFNLKNRHNDAIVVKLDSESVYSNGRLVRYVEIIDLNSTFNIKIPFWVNYSEVNFCFDDTPSITNEIIANLFPCIDSCYKLLNVDCFIRHFLKLKVSVFDSNQTFKVIDFTGLYIRHRNYYRRYSDFGTDAYIVSIIGNPIYISPYKKEPLEFDFFHSERTKFSHWHPKELFTDYNLDGYSDNSLVEIIMRKAFSYYFDDNRYVVKNFDEQLDFLGQYTIVIPKYINEIAYRLSTGNVKLYR